MQDEQEQDQDFRHPIQVFSRLQQYLFERHRNHQQQLY